METKTIKLSEQAVQSVSASAWYFWPRPVKSQWGLAFVSSMKRSMECGSGFNAERATCERGPPVLWAMIGPPCSP